MRRVIFTHVHTALLIMCGFISQPVLAGELSVFGIYCPDNVTVDCGADLSDLSIFGNAYVHGYGDPEPAPPPTEVFNLNSCGVGTVVRTWTAYDYGGYPHSCSQVIHVQGGAFGLSDITWPKDYNSDECGASFNPKDLPPGFDKPEFKKTDCGKPVAGYTDRVFKLGSDDCIKILRDWTVLDWCVYNPNAYYPKGIWTHTQVLMLKITDKPEMDCPDEVVVSTTNEACDGAYVSLDDVTAINKCGNEVKVMHNSPFADEEGANASGFYPLGTTEVVYFTKDQCGVMTHCKTKVRVKDLKQPTPVCYHGLSASLDKHYDGYYIKLEAEWFDANSFDNCTPREKLKFSVSPSVLDCDDIGEVEVVLTVTDQSGNSDFCVTYINITDNMDLCPPTTGTLTLSGSIFDLNNDPLDEVVLELSDEMGQLVDWTQLQNGGFEFHNVMEDSEFKLKALSTDDPLNGVSTFDLILMSQYILGNWEPENPLELMAADVDFSGTVDMMDVLYVRDVILGRAENFPGGSSWLIFDQQFLNDNREITYKDPVPLEMILNTTDRDLDNINFVGLKLGDLSQSAVPNRSQNGSDERKLADEFTLSFESKEKDGLYHYVIKSEKELENLFGMQFALNLDDDNHLLNIQSDYFSMDQIDFQRVDEGEIRVVVVNPAAGSVNSDQALLTLSFDRPISLEGNSGFRNEIYFDTHSPQDLVFAEAETSWTEEEQIRQFSAYPNPFGSALNINISGMGQVGQTAELVMLDITGKVVWSREIEAEYQQSIVEIPAGDLVPGVYVIQYRTSEISETIRVLKH